MIHSLVLHLDFALLLSMVECTFTRSTCYFTMSFLGRYVSLPKVLDIPAKQIMENPWKISCRSPRFSVALYISAVLALYPSKSCCCAAIHTYAYKVQSFWGNKMGEL